MKKICDIIMEACELVDGEMFALTDMGTRGLNLDFDYKIESGQIKKRSRTAPHNEFTNTFLNANDLLACELIKGPWKPRIGEFYYYLSSFSEDGVDCTEYTIDPMDALHVKREPVFKTRAEAEKAAKQRWGDKL